MQFDFYFAESGTKDKLVFSLNAYLHIDNISFFIVCLISSSCIHFILKYKMYKAGQLVPICSPSSLRGWDRRITQDQEFEASLVSSIVRPHLKQTTPTKAGTIYIFPPNKWLVGGWRNFSESRVRVSECCWSSMSPKSICQLSTNSWKPDAWVCHRGSECIKMKIKTEAQSRKTCRVRHTDTLRTPKGQHLLRAS